LSTVLLATFSGLPRSEPERVRLQYIYLYLIKTCYFQAFGECTWVHHHHGVEQVEQSKCAAVKAVRTCEDAAGTQNATYFGQQAILQTFRSNVMEHRETQRGIECRFRQTHGRSILVEHCDILARHAPLQGIGASLIDFYAGKTIDPSSQEIRRHAGARTNFENTRADVETVKDPGKDIGFDGLPPIIRPASQRCARFVAAKYLHLKLRDAQRISIGVFEPSDLCAARRVPNPKLVLLHPCILFERDTHFMKTFRRPNDVRDLPAQNRVLRCSDFLNRCNSQHRSSDIEDQGELVFADQMKTQRVAIERLCESRIACGHESHELLRTENAFLLAHEITSLLSLDRLA